MAFAVVPVFVPGVQRGLGPVKHAVDRVRAPRRENTFVRIHQTDEPIRLFVSREQLGRKGVVADFLLV